MLKLKIDEKCWYPAVIKIDEKGRNLNWRNTKLMNIDETNRNLKLITIFINFVFRQLRFLPFPSSFITAGYRHFSSILSFRQVSWIFTNFNVLGWAWIDENCKADEKCWTFARKKKQINKLQAKLLNHLPKPRGVAEKFAGVPGKFTLGTFKTYMNCRSIRSKFNEHWWNRQNMYEHSRNLANIHEN